MKTSQSRSAPKQIARRRLPLVFFGLALGIAATASAGAGQWTSTGPDGGPVTALVINPANPSAMYAGTPAGLFASQDAGATWTMSNALPPGIGSIVIDKTGQTLYATVGRLIYKTSDGGATWSKSTPFESTVVLANDPADPFTVYAATTDGQTESLVYRSRDGGSTWTSQGPLSLATTSLVVVPGTATTAYLAGEAGIFQTTDGGDRWTLLAGFDAVLGTTGPYDHFVHVVGIDPGEPQTVYAARSGENWSSLCSSSDGGSTWGCSERASFRVRALGFDHSGRAIYATTDLGLYRSVDRGMTWSKGDTGLPGEPNALAVTPDGTALFAGTSSGAYRSTDHADHWSSSGVGIHATTIPALATAPMGPARLVAGTDLFGLFGRDGDQGWKALDAASPGVLDSITAIAVSPADPATAYAGGAPGILKTTDGFNSGNIYPLTFPFPVLSIAIDPVAPTILYAGQGDRYERTLGGLSKSTDSGATWSATRLPYPAYALVIDPDRPSTLYAGADFYAADYTVGSGIFKSTDAGETWTRVDKNFKSFVTTLAIDPRHSSTIYAGTRDLGVFKSTDGATTWSFSGNASFRNVSALVVDPDIPGRLYAGTEVGVLQSPDSGQTWLPLGAGLPELPISSLAIEPDGSALHAGTAGAGVFDYPLSKSPCAAGSLCLLGNRFEVTLSATSARRGLTSGGTPVAQADRFGYFSLPEFTGDPTLPEVLVKMVDATKTKFKSFWLFYSGLTSLPYTIAVRDTITGQIRTYQSDGYCGGADTSGFKADSAADATPIGDASAGTLSASGTELSLLSNRFRITLSATDSKRNRTSEGMAIPQDDRFGYFSLPAFTGDEAFPEVFVKMVDGRPLPGNSFWVFYTGLTGLHYTLTVTDTVTGAVQTYGNNQAGSGAFCGGADTETFHETR